MLTRASNKYPSALGCEGKTPIFAAVTVRLASIQEESFAYSLITLVSLWQVFWCTGVMFLLYSHTIIIQNVLKGKDVAQL